MCGIIGYVSKKENAVDVAISGLKNLEYRGYDSAGIAFFDQNKKINIIKSQGKIIKLEEKIKNSNHKSSIAIAHTRWATHGVPNEINAHPHQVGKVTLVHNGIIENYIELRNELKEKGYEFKSETDTEVATAYIDYVYEKLNDPLSSLIEACKHFKGSYAFNVLFEGHENEIYATRKDSPLIIGYAHDGNFLASDISAVLEYTNRYCLIEENEYAVVTKDIVNLFNNKKLLVSQEIKTATWDANKYQKNGYDYFMLKEINEEPETVQNIFERYLDNKMDYLDIDFTKVDKIHIVACGSAMHAGLVGKYLFQTYAKIETMVEIASEYRYQEELITPSTLVIVVSQSGETADTIAALRIAKQKNAKVIGIVNAVGSTISREVDKCIYTYAGPEIAVATTKGYTTQVATFSTLVLHAMKQKNILDKSTFDEIKNDLLNSKKILSDVISRQDEFKEIAKKLYTHNDVFFIGRGIDSAICMEGSLKLKEISYIHSESYSAGELKHGTISLIEEGTPVIGIATEDNIKEKTISNIKETVSRGAYSIFITNSGKKEDFEDFSKICVILPHLNEFLMPIVVVTCLQLIAYECAKLKGCDIDKPKNLAKSVTVE